jgi:hypothetical protein
MQLTGDLSKVSLPNLLQLVRNGELTGKIALLQGAKTATLYVDRGDVIHAELDMITGREALMELFLWLGGSFSFFEEDMTDVPHSLNPQKDLDDGLERVVRDGLSYLEQKKFLDQLQVTGQTILAPLEVAFLPQTWNSPERQLIYHFAEPILMRIDGRKTLAEAVADANLTRRSFVIGVYVLITENLAVVREPEFDADESGERVSLPPWVVARLKQDNVDLSQAIVDMVIWVDRVKCWMYQVDADFVRILDDVAVHEEAEAPDEDFFTQLGQDNVDYQGPLFGEAAIPGTPAATATPAVSNTASAVPPAASAAGPTAATTGQASMTGAAYYGANSSPPPDETTGANQPNPQAQKKSKPSIEF